MPFQATLHCAVPGRGRQLLGRPLHEARLQELGPGVQVHPDQARENLNRRNKKWRRRQIFGRKQEKH